MQCPTRAPPAPPVSAGLRVPPLLGGPREGVGTTERREGQAGTKPSTSPYPYPWGYVPRPPGMADVEARAEFSMSRFYTYPGPS